VAPRDLRTRLSRRAGRIALPLSDELAERLLAFYELLARWNRKINLTALDDPDEAIDRLLLEPLAALRHFPGEPGKLIDIGSGGGSPAVPMKLARPDWGLTMVEAKARKSAFLREAVRTLQLGETHVETARYEELLARPDLHESFRVLSIRAVRIEARVLRSLQAFMAPEGDMFLFRGPSGPDAPGAIVPPLEWAATVPLLDSTQSRLTILKKRRVGSVPRGTSAAPPHPSGTVRRGFGVG
jgi:16S rRNA (guanine527-N7)-methyltransferase